jgi:hypothetical protein
MVLDASDRTAGAGFASGVVATVSITMTTTPHQAAIPAAVRRYASTVRTSLDLHEAGPISYVGPWLLLATLAPVVQATDEFRDTLGLATEEAAAGCRRLIEAPHPTIAAALGAWLAKGVTLNEALPVALNELPNQDGLNAWAHEKTCGLVDAFPVKVEPETMLVLASALVLTPRWRNGVYFDDEARMLRLTHGTQAVVATSAGPVAVAIPPTNDGVDVISVIAAPDVPAAKVWRAVDEVVALLDAGDLRNFTFPVDLPAEQVERGHAWTSCETVRTFWGNAAEEGSQVWETLLPEWTATTSHDLIAAPGVALVVEPIQALLPEESDVRCVQGATATYDEEGFSAAAVTAMDFVATGHPSSSPEPSSRSRLPSTDPTLFSPSPAAARGPASP